MSVTAAPAPPRRGSRAGVLGDVLLWVASIGGVICILGVIAAVVFHVTLIMFKTGSMSPTIPAGSLAIVHEIPASEIEVGDVVTVDREGQLPVTHRVTSVSGEGDTRTITMRGDANPIDDIDPYVVSTVREVWIAFPGWANVVVWFSHPLVLGGLTLGATALVTWAFWPRDERHGRRRATGGSGRTARTRPAGAGAAATTLALALALAATSAPAPAQAAEVETVIQGTYLTLTSINDPDLMSTMTTGVPVTWQLGVEAAPPDPGTVHLGVAAVAPLPDVGDFTLQVDACDERWVAGVCATGETTWLPPTDLVTAVAPTTTFGAREVGSMDSDSQTWLMLTVTMTAASQPQPAQLRLWAWGAGPALSVGGSTTDPGGLAMTGMALSLFPPLLLSVGALGTGLLISSIARRRREVAEGGDPDA